MLTLSARTVTLLFRQPVAGLQILGEDGNWTWVTAQPGTITVNLADTISHLTGGWLKSSVHRVHAPPEDQRQYKRTGLLVNSRPIPSFPAACFCESRRALMASC